MTRKEQEMIMRKQSLAAVCAAIAALMLAGCGGTPSHTEVVKQCRAALVINLRHGDLATWPRACDPLPRHEVEGIATQVWNGG